MVRINLLPREISEKRRFESRIAWVIIFGLGALAVVAVVFVGLLLMAGAKNNQLQQQLEQNATVSQQADAYAIFEQKEGELESRKAIAQVALAERVPWSQITNEISLILPTDMWLEQMSGSELDGMTMRGYALDPMVDYPDVGHTAIAAALVRLAELPLVTDVWLEDAEKTIYGGEPWGERVILFDMTTSVEAPADEETQSASSVPAPPSEPTE
jgi:Tfp pilus assembly protein PilN